MGAAVSKKELEEKLTDALIQIRGLQGFNAQLEQENKRLKARVAQLEEMLQVDALTDKEKQKEICDDDKPGKVLLTNTTLMAKSKRYHQIYIGLLVKL